MSLKDLGNMGLLRPEAQWEGEAPPTGVSLPALAAAAALGVAACAAIAIGDGGWITWLGVGAYLTGLFCFIGVNILGVGRHRKRRRPPAEPAAVESPPGPAGPTDG
jgi:hypothetical protein